MQMAEGHFLNPSYFTTMGQQAKEIGWLGTVEYKRKKKSVLLSNLQ